MLNRNQTPKIKSGENPVSGGWVEGKNGIVIKNAKKVNNTNENDKKS